MTFLGLFTGEPKRGVTVVVSEPTLGICALIPVVVSEPTLGILTLG